MPCLHEGHVHDWPDEGVLVIEKCERYCGYCTGDGAEHEWKYPWFLRRHVRNFHKRDYPNVTVSDSWTTGGAKTTTANAASLRSSRRNGKAKITSKSAAMASATKNTLARKLDGASTRKSAGRPRGKPNKRPWRASAQPASETTADRVNNQGSYSDANNDGDHGDDVSINADVSGEIDISMENNGIPEHAIESERPCDMLPTSRTASWGSQRICSGSSRAGTVIIDTTQNPMHDFPDIFDDGLRVPEFSVDGSMQFDAFDRHNAVLDLKLSWRHGLRSMANKGIAAGLFPCEVGLVMADEIDHYVGKPSTTASLSSSVSSHHDSRADGGSCTLEAPSVSTDVRDNSQNKNITVNKDKLQHVCAKLDQLVWRGYGSHFMRELCASTESTQLPPHLAAASAMARKTGADYLPTPTTMTDPMDRILRDALPGSDRRSLDFSTSISSRGFDMENNSRRSSGESLMLRESLDGQNDVHAVTTRPMQNHDAALSAVRGRILPATPELPDAVLPSLSQSARGLQASNGGPPFNQPSVNRINRAARPSLRVYDESLRESASRESLQTYGRGTRQQWGSRFARDDGHHVNDDEDESPLPIASTTEHDGGASQHSQCKSHYSKSPLGIHNNAGFSAYHHRGPANQAYVRPNEKPHQYTHEADENLVAQHGTQTHGQCHSAGHNGHHHHHRHHPHSHGHSCYSGVAAAALPQSELQPGQYSFRYLTDTGHAHDAVARLLAQPAERDGP